MFRRRDALKQLDELESRLKGIAVEVSKLTTALGETAITVSQWHQQLAEAESIMANYERTTEAAVEKVWASTNAQAQRYTELKKRLDAYDVVFRQFGVLVQKQPL